MMSRVGNSIKDPSPNRRHPLFDRANVSEFELSRLCRFVKCSASKEQRERLASRFSGRML